MLRCPNCRAQNPGINQCRRCGIELAKLQDIENTAKQLTLQALHLLIRQEPQQLTVVKNLLLKACSLQYDPLIVALLGFANSDTEILIDMPHQLTLNNQLNNQWLH